MDAALAVTAGEESLGSLWGISALEVACVCEPWPELDLALLLATAVFSRASQGSPPSPWHSGIH